MLIQREQSILLVIDVQSRLVPTIDNGEQVIEESGWLLDLAGDLNIPRIISEQYPTGLGPSVDVLGQRIDDHELFTKMHFSCLSEPGFTDRLAQLDRQQIIVTGMEAHVCVLQTVLELCEAQWQVFVVEDAIGSANTADRRAALTRMGAAGATMVTRQMVFFEWLRVAGTEEFSTLLRRYIIK